MKFRTEKPIVIGKRYKYDAYIVIPLARIKNGFLSAKCIGGPYF
jgi:hypothetical protein